MTRNVLLCVVFAGALAGTAAAFALRSSAPQGEAGPRVARLAEDACASCLMLLSDSHFAAQRVLGPDDVKLYDDHGCLLRELAKDRRGQLYFADAATGDWIPAASVRFDLATRTTPMGYGLAASRSGSLDLEAAIRRLQEPAKEKN